MSSLGIFLVFVASTSFLFAGLFALRARFAVDRETVKERLQQMSGNRPKNTSAGPSVVRVEELSQIPLLNRFLRRLNFMQKLKLLLSQADMSLSVGQVTLLMVISGLLGVIITGNSYNFFVTAVAFAACASVPVLYVLSVKTKRVREFERHFPEALDIMSNALQAGYSLSRAFQLVAKEASSPVDDEFQRTYEEIKLGMPLKDALLNLNRHMDSVDVNLFITAVLIQKESGGNLTEILGKISKTIRARFKLVGQLKIYTAQGRFSGWMLSCLPIALHIIISLFNKDYVGILFEDPTGQLMLAGAAILQVVGWVVISKITRLKY